MSREKKTRIEMERAQDLAGALDGWREPFISATPAPEWADAFRNLSVELGTEIAVWEQRLQMLIEQRERLDRPENGTDGKL